MLTYCLITINFVCQDLLKKSIRESEKETISGSTVQNDVPKKGLLELFLNSINITTDVPPSQLKL